MERKGSLRVFTPHTVIYLAQIYRTTVEALAETVSNSLDARATQTWVYLDPSRIIVVDDGMGMVPDMTQEDRQKVEEFIGGTSRTRGLDELKGQLTIASMHSLEWFVTCVALSEKFIRDDPKAKGFKGIGALAPFQFADKYVVVSKPEPDLAQRYWGVDYNDPSRIPTYRLEPPSAEQLGEQFKLAYTIRDSAEPLKDPWGKPLPQGTRIEITGLRGKAVEMLRPSLLADHLSDVFEEDLQAGARIWIVDRLTKEGRSIQGGKIVSVQVPEVSGVKLIDEVATTSAGEKFLIRIFYDRHSRNLFPKLRRPGKSVDLTQLPEFQKYPWNGGQLGGSVHFPDFPPRKAAKLWDSAKGMPIMSPERRRWIQAVLGYTDFAIGKMEEVNHRVEDQSMQRLGDALAEAVTATVREMDVFQGQLTTETRPPREAKEPGTKSKKSERTYINVVRATVFNEHNDGVPDIRIDLMKNGEILASQSTGASGTLSFGQHPDGRYAVNMICPQKLAPSGDTNYEFILHHEHRPGFRAIFRLVTGSPPVVKRELTSVRLKVYPHPWGDPDEPWRDRYERDKPDAQQNMMEINTEGRDLRQALDESDYERVSFLLANYGAAVLCHRYVEGTVKQVLLYQSRLTGRIYGHIKEAVRAQLRRLVAKARPSV